jgi:hypothetical protein
MTPERQIVVLFILALPIASIAWTVTHEDLFREPREWCVARSKRSPHLISRKIFYLFTCEYCFSHYVTGFFLLVTGYQLLFDDWRGYLIAGFSLVWVANVYMSLFARLRLEIREERVELAAAESQIGDQASGAHPITLPGSPATGSTLAGRNRPASPANG